MIVGIFVPFILALMLVVAMSSNITEQTPSYNVLELMVAASPYSLFLQHFNWGLNIFMPWYVWMTYIIYKEFTI